MHMWGAERGQPRLAPAAEIAPSWKSFLCCLAPGEPRGWADIRDKWLCFGPCFKVPQAWSPCPLPWASGHSGHEGQIPPALCCNPESPGDVYKCQRSSLLCSESHQRYFTGLGRAKPSWVGSYLVQVPSPKKWEGKWGRNNPAVGHEVGSGSGVSARRAPQAAGLQQQYLSPGKGEKSRERQRRRRNVRETRLSCAFREQALVYILLCFPGRRPRALCIFGASAPGEGEQEPVAARCCRGSRGEAQPPPDHRHAAP